MLLQKLEQTQIARFGQFTPQLQLIYKVEFPLWGKVTPNKYLLEFGLEIDATNNIHSNYHKCKEIIELQRHGLHSLIKPE